MHVNKINKKRYVGITCQDVKKRWKNGAGYINCIYFYHAIQKYGWDNFNHYILFTDLTKEEAEKKEIELIAFWNTTNSDNGYNLASGGGTCAGIKRSKETIEKIRQARLGKKHSKETIEKMKQRKYTQEQIENMRKRMTGRKHTTEEIEKIRQAHLGKARPDVTKRHYGANSPNAKKIKCITTGEIFDCISDAMRKYGISKSNISACCNGKIKTAGKMVWEYV